MKFAAVASLVLAGSAAASVTKTPANVLNVDPCEQTHMKFKFSTCVNYLPKLSAPKCPAGTEAVCRFAPTEHFAKKGVSVSQQCKAFIQTCNESYYFFCEKKKPVASSSTKAPVVTSSARNDYLAPPASSTKAPIASSSSKAMSSSTSCTSTASSTKAPVTTTKPSTSTSCTSSVASSTKAPVTTTKPSTTTSCTSSTPTNTKAPKNPKYDDDASLISGGLATVYTSSGLMALMTLGWLLA